MASKGRGAEEEGGEVVRDQEVDAEEEDYIDMDLSAAAAGPPAAREFEFMSAPLDRWGQSPADEHFYKGKLLPLHLRPRIQMVEELLDVSARSGAGGSLIGGYSTAPATPCESSSPANSCYVSGELSVEEYFQEYAAGLAADDGGRKQWARKLRFMRGFNLGLKLKASKAFLKTMFAAKPGNADDVKNVRGGTRELSRGHGHNHGHLSLIRAWRKNPFGQIRTNRRIASHSDGGGGAAPGGAARRKEREHGRHRRSFSSVMVRYSSSNKTSPPPTPPSTSSSCSTSASSPVRTSSGSDGAGAPALRMSSSASSEAEVENPIQGLIAYCKKSQQLASVRKSASDAGFRFLSSSAASKVAAESDGHDELIENLQRMKV